MPNSMSELDSPYRQCHICKYNYVIYPDLESRYPVCGTITRGGLSLVVPTVLYDSDTMQLK